MAGGELVEERPGPGALHHREGAVHVAVLDQPAREAGVLSRMAGGEAGARPDSASGLGSQALDDLERSREVLPRLLPLAGPAAKAGAERQGSSPREALGR